MQTAAFTSSLGAATTFLSGQKLAVRPRARLSASRATHISAVLKARTAKVCAFDSFTYAASIVYDVPVWVAKAGLSQACDCCVYRASKKFHILFLRCAPITALYKAKLASSKPSRLVGWESIHRNPCHSVLDAPP